MTRNTAGDCRFAWRLWRGQPLSRLIIAIVLCSERNVTLLWKQNCCKLTLQCIKFSSRSFLLMAYLNRAACFITWRTAMNHARVLPAEINGPGPVFRICWVWISVGTPTILTEVSVALLRPSRQMTGSNLITIRSPLPDPSKFVIHLSSIQ
jgi:hypothetical protein